MKNKLVSVGASVWIKSGIQAVGITGMIAVLFYKSAWGFLLFPIIWRFHYKWLKQEYMKRKTQAFEEQFMHGMQTLNQGLQTGLSMENAWREVQKEAGLMYGETSEFYQQIKDMNHSVEMNMPIESLFLQFAYASKLEGAISFAEVFSYGKRCGGNWKRLIDTVVHRMKERYETKKEIEILVAEKQMEQRIMNLMPIGMLAFLQISAGDYMEVLYHNFLGNVCMSICLAVYVITIKLSEKILWIKV